MTNKTSVCWNSNHIACDGIMVEHVREIDDMDEFSEYPLVTRCECMCHLTPLVKICPKCNKSGIVIDEITEKKKKDGKKIPVYNYTCSNCGYEGKTTNLDIFTHSITTKHVKKVTYKPSDKELKTSNSNHIK